MFCGMDFLIKYEFLELYLKYFFDSSNSMESYQKITPQLIKLVSSPVHCPAEVTKQQS